MLLPVLALAMIQTPAVLEGQRGFDLFQHCVTAIRFIDGHRKSHRGEATESNLCTGCIDCELSFHGFDPVMTLVEISCPQCGSSGEWKLHGYDVKYEPEVNTH
jgi:hypothetical protein